jgi:hypothetical protein
MDSDDLPSKRPKTDLIGSGRPLPSGYRQGVITAITVMLGFSLYFLRFWSLEAAGDWTLPTFIAAVPIFLSTICLFVALWRSLQVADDDEPVYRITLRWFLSGVLLALLGVITAAITYS